MVLRERKHYTESTWFAVWLLTSKLRLRTILINILRRDTIELIIAMMEFFLVILRSNTRLSWVLIKLRRHWIIQIIRRNLAAAICKSSFHIASEIKNWKDVTCLCMPKKTRQRTIHVDHVINFNSPFDTSEDL